MRHRDSREIAYTDGGVVLCVPKKNANKKMAPSGPPICLGVFWRGWTTALATLKSHVNYALQVFVPKAK